MLNSVLLMCSQYNVLSKKERNIFKILWLFYATLNAIYYNNLIFIPINFSAFVIVTIIISLFENEKINTLLSLISILIYSIVIDIICCLGGFLYLAYSGIKVEQEFLAYITNGCIFNAKYLLINLFMMYTIHFFKQLKIKYRKKRCWSANRPTSREVFNVD